MPDELIMTTLLADARRPVGPFAAHAKRGLRPTGFHPKMAARAEGMKLHNTFLKPWAFDTPETEYRAMCEAAVLIDVTGEEVVELTGPDAIRVIDGLVPRDVTRLPDLKCLYTVMCHSYGGILEDGIIVKFSDQHVWWSGGAAATEQWIYEHSLDADVTVTRHLDDLHVLSIQGPQSRTILTAAGLVGIEQLPYFGLLPDGQIAGVPVTTTRTGYTGELGYDIYVAPEHALRLFDALTQAGAGFGLALCGSRTLGIRRVEAAILDVDVDFDWHHTPLECGLDWMVDLKRGFVGRDALARQRQHGISSELIGLTASADGRLDTGSEIIGDGQEPIGVITSAVRSPALGCPIAIARVRAGSMAIGDDVAVRTSDGELSSALVSTLPFVDPERRRARA